MKDIRRRREFIEYAQIITRVTWSIEMSIYNQIFLIYNELDLEFRRDLNLSSESTNMNTFLTQIKNKKEIWWALNVRHRDATSIYTTSIENQRNLEDFHRSSSIVFRSNQDQDQYQNDKYRDDDFDYTSYVNQQSRNQFSTFYQFRSAENQASQFQDYQNRAYQSQ